VTGAISCQIWGSQGSYLTPTESTVPKPLNDINKRRGARGQRHLTPPPRGTSANIRIRLILLETSHCMATFLPLTMLSLKIPRKLELKQFKDIQGHRFWYQSKAHMQLLLVINSIFGPTLHRFWDTATYWLKTAYFYYPSVIQQQHPRSLCSLSRSQSGNQVHGQLAQNLRSSSPKGHPPNPRGTWGNFGETRHFVLQHGSYPHPTSSH